MLVLGTITKIDHKTNSCTVRLPIFERAGGEKVEFTNAVLAIPPGHYGGYQVGDTVVVGFELNIINQPIILGKLYLGAVQEEAQEKTSIGAFKSLKVEKTAVLPACTQISGISKRDFTGDNTSNALITIQELVDQVKELKQELDRYHTYGYYHSYPQSTN